jgi:hypothetical protein
LAGKKPEITTKCQPSGWHFSHLCISLCLPAHILYGMRSGRHGVSHGLKKCPTDTFLPALRAGPSFRLLLEPPEKASPLGWPFLVPLTGVEPVQYRYRGILSFLFSTDFSGK